ncbi:MAG: hypothetical protein HKN82_04045 [Akkermansiaceae bacterium]|nr:hypothetical protein [Akkermansiaceae bacterium]NNM30533.1 hypothetical protein [Akkermansiaceae bacterium]
MKSFVSLLFALAAGFAGLAPAKELPPVAYKKFASGFTSPVSMIPYDDGEQAFLVVDQPGVISFLGEDGGKPGAVFLDLRDRMVTLNPKFDERGALGVALHPMFVENKKVYVYYSAPLREDGPDGFDHTARLSEFTVKADGSADPASERLVLAVDQPQWNHNGGNVLFGPDGFLYLGLGDGGKSNDVAPGHEKDGNGQALNRLLGKILRIDVDSADPYGIPADNPLVGKDGRDEIFAWGIRNPWGMSFDGGNLIVADVGQNRFEEIDIIENGKNYGWSRREGYASFTADNPAAVVSTKGVSSGSEFTDPVLVYPHNESYGEAPGYGISITGGYVYQGGALRGLVGAYVFADWGTSWATRKAGLFAGVPGSDGRWDMQIVPGAKSPDGKDKMIVALAQDRAGELYVLTNAGKGPTGTSGEIWKIVPGN